MQQLTDQQLRALLEFIRESYALCDLDTFARRVISKLPKIVPSEIISYNEVNLRRRRDRYLAYPENAYTPAENKIFEHHMQEHPLITHHQKTRDNRAFKISDFLSQSQYQRLGLYNEFFRRLGVQHQMAFALPSQPSLSVGIALNRSRKDFSERDRLLLNLLSPHLIQAYRNAEVFTQMQNQMALVKQTLKKLDQGIVVLTREGRVVLANAQAIQWITNYFGSLSARGSRLPETLQRWVKHQEMLLDKDNDVPLSRKPLTVERNGKRLTVRLLSDAGQSTLLLEEQPTTMQPASLESLGLSSREAEVLTWVAYGKSNVDIGTIMGISSRTVQKHLEHIFQKLGVESRTAAAARAFSVIARN